ncbi:MAG: superoxide dismutase family protein [Oscillospiraceae bacterium]|nr:superoxide dismutase family protein [Oscillospiraceae bacterium]
MRPRSLSTMDIVHILQRQKPHAVATMGPMEGKGAITGCVSFYDTCAGTLVTAAIQGLPQTETNVFAMHIHAGETCQSPDGHLNPENRPHPLHRGDLPPLFSNRGCAWSAVVTDRLRTCDIIGKTVILHAGPDDFTTQPSGNSGPMIGCGVIRSM